MFTKAFEKISWSMPTPSAPPPKPPMPQLNPQKASDMSKAFGGGQGKNLTGWANVKSQFGFGS